MTSERGSKKTVHVDAIVNKDGLSAIAAVQAGRDARPIKARIIETNGSVEAELRSLIMAMEVADDARWRRVEFCCDSQGVVRMAQGKTAGSERLSNYTAECLEYMEDHPEWSVKWIKRTWNACAHTFASQVMKAYQQGVKAGRAGTR